MIVGCGAQSADNLANSDSTQKEGHAHLSCTVTPSKTTVADDEKISLRIKIIGGKGPFKISGSAATTTKTDVTLSASIENHTTSNQTVQRQVKVSDSEGENSSCTYRLTVRPGN